MSLRITFDVFSGRENPSVTLDANESADLLVRIGAVGPHAAKLAPAAAEAPKLGYRGIIVEQLGPVAGGLPQRFRIAGAGVSTPAGTLKSINTSVEQSILANAAILTRAGIVGTLADTIQAQSTAAKQARTAVPPATTGPFICRCAPLYEPNWWNDGATGGAKQFNNNCYNYAGDYRTDTFAQPGKASNAIWNHLTCPSLSIAAHADAFTDTKLTTITCPAEGHLVALVMWVNFDYHWYRLGRDGLWTHKPGGMPVTNLDNSGHVITDPRTADRGDYSVFCSFMIAMHGHIKLK